MVDSPVPPPTPMYGSLTTNLPHSVMVYSSFSFLPSTPLFPFPFADAILLYLQPISVPASYSVQHSGLGRKTGPWHMSGQFQLTEMENES